MRTLSVSVAFASITLCVLQVRAAGSPVMTPTPSPASTIMPMPLEQKEFWVLQETPNQRRRRLGQEIVASYPPLEYGEAVETPNQRRVRNSLSHFFRLFHLVSCEKYCHAFIFIYVF